MTAPVGACVRECSYRNRHLDDCDKADCRGCLPRRADHGHLCWPCHRRLELILTDMPNVAAWLDVHLPAGQRSSAKQDWERSGTQEYPPPPIDLGIHDVIGDIHAKLKGWVELLTERFELHGPDHADIASTSTYLLTHIDRVESSDFTKDLWEELATVTSEAHALAPWRPELRRVEGIPCPECHNCALVIFGGEEDVSCLECRLIIPKERYLIWTRIAAAEWGELA